MRAINHTVALKNIHSIPKRVFLWDRKNQENSSNDNLVKRRWALKWKNKKKLYVPVVPTQGRLTNYLEQFRKEVGNAVTDEEFHIAMSQHEHFNNYFQDQVMIAEWEKYVPQKIRIRNFRIHNIDTSSWIVQDVRITKECHNCVPMTIAHLLYGDARFYKDIKARVQQEFTENVEWYKNFGYLPSLMLLELEINEIVGYSNAAIQITANALDICKLFFFL